MNKDPLTVTKAKAYLEKALSQDSSYLPAILMLVDILEQVYIAWQKLLNSNYEYILLTVFVFLSQEAQLAPAIQLLTKEIEVRVNPPHLHLRLAKLLCKDGAEDKAADHFAITLK